MQQSQIIKRNILSINNLWLYIFKASMGYDHSCSNAKIYADQSVADYKQFLISNSNSSDHDELWLYTYKQQMTARFICFNTVNARYYANYAVEAFQEHADAMCVEMQEVEDSDVV